MRTIFKALRYETDRCTAAVVLWSRTIDREGIYEAFRSLSPVEQRQVGVGRLCGAETGGVAGVWS